MTLPSKKKKNNMALSLSLQRNKKKLKIKNKKTNDPCLVIPYSFTVTANER